jgi:membrane-bound lytic murein transglycosylase D
MVGGRRDARTGRARGRIGGVLVLAALLAPGASPAHAGPEDPAADRSEGRSRVGPLWMSDVGRMRVRGMRHDDASIHVAHASHRADPEAELRRALEAFEARALPAERATPLATIVADPPEAWMAALKLPAIPVRWNHKTVEYLRYFRDDRQGQALIRAWLTRMGRYQRQVHAILDEVGVPRDLAFVALVESGFRPDSTNPRSAAGGMWQFMEPTGRVYGLTGAYWSDDRYDYVKATWAAAAYFRDLKVRFGSWEMALAAYNAGYGLVMTAIRRNNTNNYWALCEIEAGLPNQTTNYVPKLLAAAIVARNPAAFGLADLQPLAAATPVEVQVPPATRLDELAAAVGADPALVAELNAGWIRGRTPPKGGPFTVRLPREALGAFEKLGPDLRGAVQPVATRVTLLGDDLADIAREHGVTERHLRQLNGIEESGEVHEGITLVVPTERGAENGSEPAPLPPLAAVPPLNVPAGQRRVFFRTTRATAPQRIARGFGVGWADIVAWNDLDPHARLQDALMLQILVPAQFDGRSAGVRIFEEAQVRHVVRGTQAHLEAVLAERGLVRRGYKVRKGDTMEKIAKRFKTTVGSLARINMVRRSSEPEAGDVVVVYVEENQVKHTVAAPPPAPTTLTAELVTLESDARRPAPTRAPSTADSSRLPGRSDAEPDE